MEDVLNLGVFFYSFIGKHDKAVAIVEERFASVDELLEQYPRTDSLDLGYMPDLAWSYRQLDRQEDFDKVVLAMRNALAVYDAENSIFFPVVTSDINMSAVIGDVDGVLAKAQKLVDMNLVTVEPFFEPYFDQYLAREEFRAMKAVIVQRANDERAKLELPPYQPTAFVNR